MMHCKHTGKIEYDLTNRKKISLVKSCSSFQKTSRLLTIFFPDFNSFFQTFSKSGKLLGKFQDFFKNSRLCTNPVLSPKSDQRQISPDNISTTSRAKAMRINKMIIKGKMLWSFITFSLLILKEMHRDQSREFLCGHWGLKGIILLPCAFSEDPQLLLLDGWFLPEIQKKIFALNFLNHLHCTFE